jgi:hypothetical protein
VSQRAHQKKALPRAGGTAGVGSRRPHERLPEALPPRLRHGGTSTARSSRRSVPASLMRARAAHPQYRGSPSSLILSCFALPPPRSSPLLAGCCGPAAPAAACRAQPGQPAIQGHGNPAAGPVARGAPRWPPRPDADRLPPRRALSQRVDAAAYAGSSDLALRSRERAVENALHGLIPRRPYSRKPGVLGAAHLRIVRRQTGLTVCERTQATGERKDHADWHLRRQF